VFEWWIPVSVVAAIALIGAIMYIGTLAWYATGARKLLILVGIVWVAKILHATWYEACLISILSVVLGGWLLHDWEQLILQRAGFRAQEQVKEIEQRVADLEWENGTFFTKVAKRTDTTKSVPENGTPKNEEETKPKS